MNNITAIYNPAKRKLKIFKDNKLVGGFGGDIALRMYRRIVFNNIKKIRDGKVCADI